MKTVMVEYKPLWLPEIGLGIGTGLGVYRAWKRKWLYWYDNEGNRLPAPEEVAQQERQRADRLASQLRQIGIDHNRFIIQFRLNSSTL